MNKHKALFKYEWKTLKWMSLYFLLGLSCIVFELHRALKHYYILYLNYSFEERYFDANNSFSSIMGEVQMGLLVVMIMGLFLMIFIQFRDSKNVEVGRFLKALPIKNKEVYLIRISSGLLCFSLPYMIYSFMVLKIRSSYIDFLEEAYSLTVLMDLQKLCDSTEYTLKSLLLVYLSLVAVYLFLMMMQYLITQPIVSMVIASLISFSPLYLMAGVTWWVMKVVNSQSLEDCLAHLDPMNLLPMAYGIPDESAYMSMTNGIYGQVRFIGDMEMKLIILGVICLLCLWGGSQLSQGFKVEHADELVSFEAMRKILIAGITLCMAVMPSYFYEMFATSWQFNIGISLIAALIMAVIGFFASRKLVSIGKSR